MSVHYKKGNYRLWTWPVDNAVVIAKGDFLYNSSGKAVKMTNANQNLTFIGVAYSAHDGDGAGEVSVYMPLPETEFEITLNTASTIKVGDNLAWSADQVVAASDTDAIFRVTEAGTTVSKALCAPKLPVHLIGDLS